VAESPDVLRRLSTGRQQRGRQSRRRAKRQRKRICRQARVPRYRASGRRTTVSPFASGSAPPEHHTRAAIANTAPLSTRNQATASSSTSKATSASILAHPAAQSPPLHNPQVLLASQFPLRAEPASSRNPTLPWNSARPRQSAARLWNPVNYLPRDLSQPQQQRHRANSKGDWRRGDPAGGAGVAQSYPLRAIKDVKGKQPLWQLEAGNLGGKRGTFGFVPAAMGENADGDGGDAVAPQGKGDNGDAEAKEQERRRQSADHARRVQQSLRQGDGETQLPAPAHLRDPTSTTTNTDLERGDAHQNGRPSSSRVGIPPRDSIRSQPSFQHFYPTQSSSQYPQSPTRNNHNNHNNNTAGNSNGPQDDEDDYGWGPSHPCFPHQNTHVPIDSPEATTTRIIRIRRDWMIAGDLAPTFSNLYPEILDPYLPEEEFRLLIRRLNDELTRAFDPWSLWNWVDAVMGVLTLWVWDDLGATVVKRRLRALEDWIKVWNEKEGKVEGVKVVELRRTGYMSVWTPCPIIQDVLLTRRFFQTIVGYSNPRPTTRHGRL
jgi:Golgin subfamily A member 7/ERF4 family